MSLETRPLRVRNIVVRGCVLTHESVVRNELAGLAQAGKLGYVVPAGGLGERLGYHGVKFALPSEISTGASVLRVCARTTR